MRRVSLVGLILVLLTALTPRTVRSCECHAA